MHFIVKMVRNSVNISVSRLISQLKFGTSIYTFSTVPTEQPSPQGLSSKATVVLKPVQIKMQYPYQYRNNLQYSSDKSGFIELNKTM